MCRLGVLLPILKTSSKRLYVTLFVIAKHFPMHTDMISNEGLVMRIRKVHAAISPDRIVVVTGWWQAARARARHWAISSKMETISSSHLQLQKALFDSISRWFANPESLLCRVQQIFLDAIAIVEYSHMCERNRDSDRSPCDFHRSGNVTVGKCGMLVCATTQSLLRLDASFGPSWFLWKEGRPVGSWGMD